MSYPTVQLEIESFTGAWTDVSANIRSIKTKRGKSKASEAPGAGSMFVVLGNANRAYDPEHTGIIPRPGQRIRLRATWNSITYYVFKGWVDRITQAYNPPRDATAILECSDGISRLEAAHLPSVWEIATKALSPLSWYRLGETAGPSAYNRAGTNHGTYSGAPVYNSHTLQSADDDLVKANDGAVHFKAGGNDYLTIPAAAVPTTAAWTLELYVAIATPPSSNQFLIYDALYPKGIVVWFDTVGKFNVSIYKPDGTLGAYARCNFVTANGLGYMMQVIAEPGLPLKVLFGGYDFTEAASGTAHALNSGGLVVGHSPVQAVTVDELSFYARALTVAERTSRTNAEHGWDSQTVNTRSNKILDAIGWAEGRSITTEGDDVLAGANLGVSTLTHLKALAATIGGRLWVTADGTIKLLGRTAHSNPPYSVSQATFGDGVGELGYTKAGDYVLDYELLTNVVRRHNHGNYAPQEGSITVASDAASIAKYGLRDQRDTADVESLYLTLAYEYTLAMIQLAKYANPRTYVNSLEFSPAKDPINLWPQALGREISDRITFKRWPQRVGAVISMETIIEGITHSIGPKHWTTTFSIDATDA